MVQSYLEDGKVVRKETDGGVPAHLEITQRVAAARQAAGMTKTEFAQRLGLSKQAYNGYEKGETPFSVVQLFRVAEVMNLPITHFLGLESELSQDEQHLVALYRKGQSRGMGDAILRTVKALSGE
jgi:transcriptional regulator with XRE-family HTH domain